jgi:hypothetical protein
MQLISRRRKQTPIDKALQMAGRGLRALVAVRMARKSVRVAKKAPLLVAGGAAGVLAIRKMRGAREVHQSPPPPPVPTA